MQRFISIARVSAMALAMSGVLAVPVSAAPLRVGGPLVTSNVVKAQVQYRGHETFNEGLRRRHGRYYYRGHRVYRHRRPGYRRYGDWWVPPALFGLFVGGAILNQQRSMSRAHIRWCYRHYRSYREWDNTFQPYHGPRRQCVSPYY
jgi:hypothetical protein